MNKLMQFYGRLLGYDGVGEGLVSAVAAVAMGLTGCLYLLSKGVLGSSRSKKLWKVKPMRTIGEATNPSTKDL